MKTWQIWSEGYEITGNRAGAHYHGEVEAQTFPDACRIKFEGDKTFDPERLTLWGCELFDNEKEAREHFG